MNDEHMVISEVFGPTFQGEGPSMGRRAYFVRLGGCNLSCTWCDTPYTWRWGTGSDYYNPREELKQFTLDEVCQLLQEKGYTGRPGEILVITGGEPMLQQERIVALVRRLDKGVAFWKTNTRRIEIETNGTIEPNDSLDQMSMRLRFNVSPKLSGAGNAHKSFTSAIVTYAAMWNANFKFVISKPEEVDEVVELTRQLPYVPVSRIWCMPEGRTAEELETKLKWLAPLVLARGWNLTTRLHVLIWNDERGN